MIIATAQATAPLALKARDRIDGPWLAVLADKPPEAAAVVLCGDPRAPQTWRSLDDDAPLRVGRAAHASLIALSDFAVACTLYPHSRVVALVKSGISRARRQGLRHAEPIQWAGARVERIRVARSLWPLVAAAAKDNNLALIARGLHV